MGSVAGSGNRRNGSEAAVATSVDSASAAPARSWSAAQTKPAVWSSETAVTPIRDLTKSPIPSQSLICGFL